MKNIYLVILLSVLFSLDLFAQSDSSGWIYKDGYREQKLKVGAITFIRYSKDGKYIYTFGKDTTLRKWEVCTGQVVSELIVPCQTLYVSSYLFDLSSDETKILYYSKTKYKPVLQRLKDSTIIEVNQDYNYKMPSKYCYPFSAYTSYQFNPVANQIYVCTGYETNCYDEETEAVISKTQEGRIEVYSSDWGSLQYTTQEGVQSSGLTFSPNGAYEAHNVYYSIKVNNPRKGQSYSREDSYIALVDRFYNSTRTFKAGSNHCRLTFSPDNRYLACADYLDRTGTYIIKVSDLSIFQKFAIYVGMDDIGFTKDVKYLVSGYSTKNNSSINFTSLATGEHYNSVKFDTSASNWLFTFDRNSSDFATGTSDGIIRIFDSTLTISVKAGFSVDTNKIIVNDTVRFHNLSTGNPTIWDWDFGDGKFGSGKDPVHVYTKPGTYTVKLIVRNGWSSDTLVKNNFITVEPEPAGVNDNNSASRLFFSVTPNPVTESSSIYFFLDKPQPVQIKIYNQLGQEVAQIVDGYFNSGSNNISFNPQDYALPSGLYYIRLSAGGDIETRMISWGK